MTFLESEFKDAGPYTELVFFVLLYATLITAYTLWIIAIPLKIKKTYAKMQTTKSKCSG